MHARYILLLATIFCMSCNAPTNQATNDTEPGKMQRISAAEFKAQLATFGDQANLVDVRTPEEFAAGAIEGAVNINWHDNNFAEQMNKLDKNKPIMVYCQAGGRSKKACGKLEELGFKEIYELKVGYGGWVK